ncbi:MAG: hypothetical protein IPG80_07020 [Anaerolineales bacterium]|uniref:hypothetical protein n=1 Tax=Candidatus Villigracilis vicinus TaxID=3140679 RepID=UPI0031363B1C|nr:hypothetical protein [Anaerolineales bacterium]
MKQRMIAGDIKYNLVIASIALMVSFSLVLLGYINYFQSYGLSFKRGVVALGFTIVLATLVFSILKFLIAKQFSNDLTRALKSLGFSLFISVLFSPCFAPIPHYPASPLFQPVSRIKITLKPEENKGTLQLKGVWLRFNEETFSNKEFVFSSEWASDADKYFLSANAQGELYWEGRIGEHATLTIFPPDGQASATVLWDDEETSSVLADAPFVVKKKSATPTWYYILIILLCIGCLGFALFVFFNLYQWMGDSKSRRLVVVLVLSLLTVYTVYTQFENPEIKGRLEIQEGRHMAVMTGTALNPWQYRVFAEWLIEGAVRLSASLGLGQGYFAVFLALRLIQNAVIFGFVYVYFQKIGFSKLVALVGILFVTGSMLNSFHQSDLSFNTYFDVIFYLAAVLLILKDLFVWLPVLMVAAAMNRETSGLIPFLAITTLPRIKDQRSKVFLILLSLVVWVGVFLALRALYPDRELFIPYGYQPGLPLLSYNLTLSSFELVVRFFSFAPLVGMLMYKDWMPVLKRFFITLIPVWFMIHLIGSVISEARLFLVPQLLVFIPAFLVFVQHKYERYFPAQHV